MMIMRESFWWLLATGMVGLMLGYSKGIPRWGFLLGLFLGPIGCGIVMMLPSQRTKTFRTSQASQASHNAQDGHGTQDQASNQGPFQSSNASSSYCPRCRQAVSANAKVCVRCGNVLMPVRYQVLPDEKKG
jgi:hypothetical protein